MRRALFVAVGWALACGSGGNDGAAPFEPTAFEDLAPVATNPDGFTVASVRVTDDGEAFCLGSTSGYDHVALRYDVRTRGAITPLPSGAPETPVGISADSWFALEDGVRIVSLARDETGAAGGGADLAVRDGGAWVALPRSPLPMNRIGFSEDYALLSEIDPVEGPPVVRVVDRDVYLAGGAGHDDVIATIALPAPYTTLMEATAVGDVVFLTSSSGVFAFDLASPEVPFAHLGSSASALARRHGDLLVIGELYDLLFFDVSDPHAPAYVGFAPGGGIDVAFDGDVLYGVDRDSLIEVDLSDPRAPTPVGWQPLAQETLGVDVVDGSVFVVSAGQLVRLEEG